MQKLVLLTGITGKSGRYALERLAERRAELDGMRLRALVRPSSDTSCIQNCGLEVELVRGDFFDDACLAECLRGVDTVLHIIGIHESPRLMRFAAEAGVKRALLVHTTGIYSKYKSASREYIEIDMYVTRLAQQKGVKLTILRPTMIYGGTDDQNVVKFIRMADRLPIIPAVAGARFALQPVHRGDLGRAYADALLAGDITAGNNYVLSGKEPITLREMFTVICEQLGKKARFIRVPYWIAIGGAWALYGCSFARIDYREKVQRLVEPRAYPHEGAAADFGYAPRGFSEGVSGEIAAYLSAKKQGR